MKLRCRTFRRGPALCAFALSCLLSANAGAAELHITLPTLTAPPGATVIIPIDTSPGPAGLGILAAEFRMNFAPGVIQASASRPDGWVRSWGPAFVNANDAFIAVAAGGFPAVASAGTRLNTLELVISPLAPPGTDMPLAFQHVLFNEGEPSVVVTPGLLRVRANAAVEPGVGAGLALSPASPNPAANLTRFTLAVPSGGAPSVRMAVYSVDGRLVRELANGPLGPGMHEFRWDTRDAAGRQVRAGLYFTVATCGTERRLRRLAITR